MCCGWQPVVVFHTPALKTCDTFRLYQTPPPIRIYSQVCIQLRHLFLYMRGFSISVRYTELFAPGRKVCLITFPFYLILLQNLHCTSETRPRVTLWFIHYCIFLFFFSFFSFPPRVTSEEHLLQQVVYLGQAAELNELELLDHLPGDALQGGQQEQQLPETTPRVVLPVVNVVLQAHLHLSAQAWTFVRGPRVALFNWQIAQQCVIVL